MTQAHDSARFQGELRWTTEAIEQRLAVYMGLLRSGAAAFTSRGDFKIDEFQAYVERLRLREFYPGIQGIGFARRVTAADTQTVTQWIRQTAHTNFTIYPPGPRPEYFPIVYLEPMDFRNRQAIGYDMFSEPVRNEAMKRAGEIGQISVSGKVTLVQEVDENKQAGFLAYAPIYAQPGGIPATIEERKATLLGFFYAPFRASDMFRGIFGDQEPQLHFRVYDGQEMTSTNLLHANPVRPSAHPHFRTTISFNLEGRTWTMLFESSPEFEDGSSRSLVWWALFSGLAVSCLVAAITFSLGQARTRAEAYGRQLAAAQQELKTHAESLESTVLERTRRLRETIAELEAFSYSLSHDMRAPLRSIQSFSQFVLADYGDRLPPEAHDYLGRVIAASKRMDRLIFDVLSYTRLSRQEIDIHPVDVRKLVNGIINEQPEMQPPNAEIEVGELPRVLGHEGSLTQCLANLLGNAVKFVPAGEKPKVKVHSTRANGQARIIIEDNGIGIEQKNIERVFALFERPHTGGRYEGTGLGLAIARKAVERMFGRIGVDSELGKGSRFWIELPEAPDDGRAGAFDNSGPRA